MATRFVDLQRELRTLEQDGATPCRYRRRGEKLDRFASHALRFFDEPESHHALVTSLPRFTIAVGRKAATLRAAVVAERDAVHARAAEREELLDVGAFGGEQVLVLARPAHARL